MGATATTYINPAVAILVGVLLLGEPFTVWTGVGFALVLLGAYLVTKPRKAPLGVEVEPAEGAPAVAAAEHADAVVADAERSERD